jgi:hypothetical protein
MNKKLEKKLDVVFSKYIRAMETKQGYGTCVSCKALKPFEQFDAGHFINRKWRATRWHEDNVHIQCRSCNRFDEGNSAGYALYMLERYGKNHLEYLQGLSRETAKFTDSEGELLLNDYKKKLKALQT